LSYERWSQLLCESAGHATIARCRRALKRLPTVSDRGDGHFGSHDPVRSGDPGRLLL